MKTAPLSDKALRRIKARMFDPDAWIDERLEEIQKDLMFRNLSDEDYKEACNGLADMLRVDY